MHEADARLIRDMLATVAQRLDRMERLLLALVKGDAAMSASLDNLTAKVTNENNVIDSAITLINGLAAEIKAANSANDPALDALANSIQAKSDALAAAVAANTTPPAPAAAPTPPAA